MKAAHPEDVAANRVNPGETLRQARESNGWSLAEVALKLNLTSTSLANLEAGAFDKLPGHTFARGYIRAYAKLLGIDQAVLVQEFDQFTGTDAQGSNVHGLGRIEEPTRVSHTILRIVSLLLLIAVVGGGFVWWQDQTSQRNKDLTSNAMEHVEVESADFQITQRTHGEIEFEGHFSQRPTIAFAGLTQGLTGVYASHCLNFGMRRFHHCSDRYC